jgi:hypothetical protein
LVLRIPFTPFIPVKIFHSSPFLSWVPGRCCASVTAWFSLPMLRLHHLGEHTRPVVRVPLQNLG